MSRNESSAVGGPGLTPGPPRDPSRRRLLAGAGAALGAGAVAGGVAAYLADRGGNPASGAGGAAQTVPFYGAHQAGIATPAQDRLAFGSLNVVSDAGRADVRDLLRAWTDAAARMTRGHLVGEDTEMSAPPVDTGEAVGSPVSRLTITIGFGSSLFGHRFGLAGKRPAALAPLPPLPNENLDPNFSGGDLCVQACSDDPLVAFHAVRNLARLGMGVVAHNWMELGFGRTSTTTTAQATPRNLLGFKDGTRNIKAEQTKLMDEHVWVGPESDQPWLRGGSYLVSRKIRMFVENWDRDYLQDQENVIGRAKVSGAPLSGGTEFTAPNFAARKSGQHAIPPDSHIRLASHEHNGGTRILRRGYSFTDGIDPQAGTLLGGLFFIAFMKNPSQFVKLQQALADDALNEYIHHTGSAVFACPPGLRPGQHWGDTLFA
jgi:deferrochelatase/peroxidase EfeB